MTPQGHFISLNKAIVTLARTGDLVAFRNFMVGRFREQITLVPPAMVIPALEAVERAKKACSARTRQPAKPKPITAKAADKLSWQNNPALCAKLARAYAKAGPDNHHGAAALMRISPGQARQAKRRYLDGAATLQLQKAA